MASYRELLEKEAERRGWNKTETNVFDTWRQSVARKEGFRGDPALLQKGGGPGRGKYQYEIGEGMGADTARNHLIQYLKKNNLSLKDLPAKDQEILDPKNKKPDFSKLSEDTQDMAFLADKVIGRLNTWDAEQGKFLSTKEAPSMSLDALVKGNINYKDAWLNWHWKGSNVKDREQRAASWDRDVKVLGAADALTEPPKWMKPLQTAESQRPSMGLAGGPAEGGLFAALAGLYRDYQEKQKTADLNDWEEPGAFKMPPSFAEEQAASEIMMGVGDTTPVDTTPQPEFFYDAPQTRQQIFYDQPAPKQQYATMEELLMDRGLMNPLMRR